MSKSTKNYVLIGGEYNDLLSTHASLDLAKKAANKENNGYGVDSFLIAKIVLKSKPVKPTSIEFVDVK